MLQINQFCSMHTLQQIYIDKFDQVSTCPYTKISLPKPPQPEVDDLQARHNLSVTNPGVASRTICSTGRRNFERGFADGLRQVRARNRGARGAAYQAAHPAQRDGELRGNGAAAHRRPHRRGGPARRAEGGGNRTQTRHHAGAAGAFGVLDGMFLDESYVICRLGYSILPRLAPSSGY